MKETKYKILDTDEERTEAAVEKLLDREYQLKIQRLLAPDLTDD